MPEGELMAEHQNFESHNYDVVVVGAGGAGLRAAIEAHERGARTAIVCKSLLGKAHTVMAEGGIAASMGNVWSDDNWKVHFRDTMRGGKMLNNWRMAQLHAQEAPDRVFELEEWGAVFDRTDDGRILQRDFGGHRYARLAHVGDRTGLELIRTLQNRAVGERIDVFMECTVLRLLTDSPAASGRMAGVFGYWRESGTFLCLSAPSVILATGGIGKSYQVTSNSWEYTGDGHALALEAGAELMDMEFVQFHPTGMVWPPSVKGILVTEGVRGDGGVLRNSEGRRFMFDYIPEVFASETADTEEEADRWYDDKKNARRPPELLPRDEVARAINSEIKAGRGSPHGGVFLDIASRKPAAVIQRRLPSMYHQFKELADVDITKEAMEVGPTCHYVMGGIRVDADTAGATVPGLFAAGECAAGMHGSNRLGGNSLGDLLVFGRRAGQYAAEYAAALPKKKRPTTDPAQVDNIITEALAPFERDPLHNPYTVHTRLQQMMQELVGIIRKEDELKKALDELEDLRREAARAGVEGHRQFNPGWHLALDLRNMIRVSECIATAALARRESRGGHTRDDYPSADPEFGSVNHVLDLHGGTLRLRTEPLPRMPDELRALFDPIPAPVPPQPAKADVPPNAGDASSSGADGQAAQPGPAGLAPTSKGA
jgi:succinate dehydrogenase / fumarate reductase flavoprotein subunit